MSQSLSKLICALLVLCPTLAFGYCPWNVQDLDADDESDVLDVQCSLLLVLSELSNGVAEHPCQEQAQGYDLNCDHSWAVADTLLMIHHALGLPLDFSLDSNSDNCVDSCLANADGDVAPDWQDCAPSNPAIFPGQVEICDGFDNNCVQGADEGFNLGTPCVNGVGACATPGVRVCAGDGFTSVCAGNPSPVKTACDDNDLCTTNDTCVWDADTQTNVCEGLPKGCDSPFASCDQGRCAAELVFIPDTDTQVSFNRGSCEGCHYDAIAKEADPDTLFGASPMHLIDLPYAFHIDETETTNSQFVAFLNGLDIDEETQGTGCNGETCFDDVMNMAISFKPTLPEETNGTWAHLEGAGEHPAVRVTWAGAAAYCESLSRRLCTDAEWEFAARGIQGWEFPWGEVTPNCNNHFASLSECPGWPEPVGSHPLGVSPFGVQDMVGSANEYTENFYYSDYYCHGPESVCDGLLPTECGVDCLGKAPYQQLWTAPTGMPTGKARTIRGQVVFLPFFIANQTFLRTPVPQDHVGSPGDITIMDNAAARGIRCCKD